MKRLILIIFFASICNGTEIDLRNSDLVKQMKLYVTPSNNWHAGNLIDHSIWTAKCLENWFDNGSLWIQGIDAKDKKIMMLAGFMHDIGKSGDLKYSIVAKHDHPRIGFEYLINKRPFVIRSPGIENSYIDFNKLFKKLNLTDKEKKIVAILVGAHWNFGACMRDITKFNVKPERAYKEFLDKLLKLVIEADYNNRQLDKKIVLMNIALGGADVKGAIKVGDGHCCNSILEIGTGNIAHPEAKDNFKILGMDTVGLSIREDLLKYFEDSKLASS